MKVLVIGGGGREHAIIRKLKESPELTTLYCLPGNAGIAADSTCGTPTVCLAGSVMDADAIVAAIKREGINFTVVSPDDPLAAGVADAVREAGCPAFGPSKAAAQIEASKAFSKGFMKRHAIPTANYEVFDKADEALASIKKRNCYPTVIKADGLALGKGVVIAADYAEAEAAVKSMMLDRKFGESGSRVVVEDFMTGPEVTVLSLTDGKTIVPMVSSMDHKRALDGDNGLNTGGMGVVAPNPFYTDETAAWCMEHIYRPTVAGLAEEGRPFKGCLYFGLMLTPDGPKVVEYNCRFGDPEAEAVLPLLESDLFAIMRAVENGTLSQVPVRFSGKASACVVLATKGYPEHYEKGFAIEGLDATGGIDGAQVFHMGTSADKSGFKTAGGRVLCVTALGVTLQAALDAAYAGASRIHCENLYCRRDIGARALRSPAL
jgi:phosphoribosylamine--glycine ligase